EPAATTPLPGVSVALGQVATQGLDAALDQARRGGRGPAEPLGDVRQGPTLQVAQADRLPLVFGERRQGLRQALGLLTPDGPLARGGEVGIEALLQGSPAPLGIVQRALPPHVALLEQGVVPDGAGDLVVQDAPEPGAQFARIPAGELWETAIRLQERLLNDV